MNITFGQSFKQVLNTVDIEINRHCNLKCPYCPNVNNPESTVKKFIDPNLFKKILAGLQKMNFSGSMSYHFFGEPLLHPKLEEFIAMTKEKLPQTSKQVFTNGTLLTLKRLQSLLSSGVDKIVLTQHYKNNPFMKNLKNIPDELLEKVDIKFPNEQVFSNRGGTLDNVARPPVVFDKKCLFVKGHMNITIDGDVLPCCDDYNRVEVMGNVNTDDLSNIWNSEHYVKFREELAEKGNRDYAEICKKCNRTNDHSVRHQAVEVKKN